MEIIIFILLLSWLIWGITRGVFILSILFLLTPRLCKKKSISFALKHTIETNFRWTMAFMILLLFLVKPYVFAITVTLPMFFAISVSISLRRKFSLKNSDSKTESSGDD